MIKVTGSRVEIDGVVLVLIAEFQTIVHSFLEDVLKGDKVELNRLINAVYEQFDALEEHSDDINEQNQKILEKIDELINILEGNDDEED